MASREPRSFGGDQHGARRWISSTFQLWAAALSTGQRQAVRDYKGEAYRDVNARLRAATEDLKGDQLVAGLDGALSIFRLPEPVVVWRGFEHGGLRDALDAGDELRGRSITDPAYLSTSLLESTAREYLAAVAHPDNALLGRIVLLTGTHVGSYVGAPDLVTDLAEAELLLPRATPLRISAVDLGAGGPDDVPTIHFEVDP